MNPPPLRDTPPSRRTHVPGCTMTSDIVREEMNQRDFPTGNVTIRMTTLESAIVPESPTKALRLRVIEWVLSSWLSKMVSKGSEHNREPVSLAGAVDSKQMSRMLGSVVIDAITSVEGAYEDKGLVLND